MVGSKLRVSDERITAETYALKKSEDKNADKVNVHCFYFELIFKVPLNLINSVLRKLVKFFVKIKLNVDIRFSSYLKHN